MNSGMDLKDYDQKHRPLFAATGFVRMAIYGALLWAAMILGGWAVWRVR